MTNLAWNVTNPTRCFNRLRLYRPMSFQIDLQCKISFNSPSLDLKWLEFKQQYSWRCDCLILPNGIRSLPYLTDVGTTDLCIKVDLSSKWYFCTMYNLLCGRIRAPSFYEQYDWRRTLHCLRIMTASRTALWARTHEYKHVRGRVSTLLSARSDLWRQKLMRSSR